MANTRLFKPKDGRRQHKRYRATFHAGRSRASAWVELENVENGHRHNVSEATFNKRYVEV